MEITQQQIIALEKKVGSEAKSPLFAQLAHYYLEMNRAQDALRLCDAGLANFPFYTTGHLVKGKALVALNMRAEARREFELVLDLLPNNETVSSLLVQIPPSEEETLTVPQQQEQPEMRMPEQALPSAVEYEIPSTLQPSPEQGYGVAEIEQPTPEQQPEPPPLTTPSSGAPFFDEITQAPIATATEDPFGFKVTMPSIEAPAPPEPSPLGGFEVATPPTEQPSGFEFALTTPEVSIPMPLVPVEEESFEHYASRRRSELSGEDTISLEDYLSNTTLILPQALPSTAPISIDLPGKVEEFPTSPSIDLPQAPPPETPISIDILSTSRRITKQRVDCSTTSATA